jgi:hypothetical protein
MIYGPIIKRGSSFQDLKYNFKEMVLFTIVEKNSIRQIGR